MSAIAESLPKSFVASLPFPSPTPDPRPTTHNFLEMTANSSRSSARETMEILHEMSKLLNTGLDKETLSICVSLCESGVNPEALATVVKELKRERKMMSGARPQSLSGDGLALSQNSRQ